MAISKKYAQERLKAVVNHHPVSCEDATELECICSCKGAKHGINKYIKLEQFFMSED